MIVIGDPSRPRARGGQTGGQPAQAPADSARPTQSVCTGEGEGSRFGFAQTRAYPPRLLRDEEAAGSNPATPTEKFQVDGMIAKRGDHVIDRLLAIRWRDRTSTPGMRRGESAGNATAGGHRPSRIERVPALPSCGKSGGDGATPSFASRGSGVQIPSAPPKPAGQSHDPRPG
jgi:hypothetical protein